MNATTTIFTVGHSDHSVERFDELLNSVSVEAVVDVRSHPRSKWNPQFDREALARHFDDSSREYFYLGQALGGRPRSRSLYCDGIADYQAMGETGEFAAGLEKLLRLARHRRVALMCSEGEPLDCHRCLLVGRRLNELGFDVENILPSGVVEPQWQTEERLLTWARADNSDLFIPVDDMLSRAYLKRSEKVAYRKPNPQVSDSGPGFASQ